MMLDGQQKGDTMGEFLGKRVVPRHEGDWDKARSYEPLMIVLDPETGDGYISRYDVPAGTLLTNEHYWAKCSHFNAQMHRLETDVAEDVEGMHSDLASTKAAMSEELSQTHQKMAEELSETENRMDTDVKNAVSAMKKTEAKMDDSVDMLTKRLDANVTARTDKNADYAAELVDSRVDYMGQIHENVGTAIRKQVQGIYRAFGFGEVEYKTADRSDMTEESFSGEHFYVANNDVYSVDLYLEEVCLVSAVVVANEQIRLLTMDADNVIINDYGTVLVNGNADEIITIKLPRRILLPAGNRLLLYHEKGFSKADSGIILKMRSKGNPLAKATGFVTSNDKQKHTVGDALNVAAFGNNTAVWFAASVADFPYAKLEEFIPLQQEIEDARTNGEGVVYSSLGEAIRALEPFVKIKKEVEFDREQYKLGASKTTVQHLYANGTVYPDGTIKKIRGYAVSKNKEQQDFLVVTMNSETKIITDCKWVYYVPTITDEAEEICIENIDLRCNRGDCLFIGASNTGAVLAYAQKIAGSRIYGFFPNDKAKIKPGDLGGISQDLPQYHLCVMAEVLTQIGLTESVNTLEDRIHELNDQLSKEEKKRADEMEKLSQRVDSADKGLQEQITKVSENANQNRLFGKKIVAIGDSMTYGHNVTGERNWLGKIAVRNKMAYVNYGRNGCYMSYNVAGGTYPPEISVVARYGTMDDDADYILVFAGTNDASAGIEIGAENSKDNKTFMGALNEICEGLQTKYPKGKIGFITPYRRSAQTEKYANAIETICAKYGIPVFNNIKNGGINFANAKQKEALTLGDSLHLNEAGMEVASWKYEAFLLSL